MSQNNKVNNIQKRMEKRLSFENLESRQLLSAAPLSMEADYAAAISYATTSNDLQVDLSTSQSEAAPIALQAQGTEGIENLGESVVLNADSNRMALTVEGGKLVTQVLVNPGTVFTVAFIGYDNSGVGQDVIEFKNFNAVHTNVKDGVFTYNYPAKENYTYNVLLIKSRFTAKDYANYGGYIPDNVILEYDTISTLSKLEFAAKPGSATSDSITILQKSGTQLQTLDNLVFSAKFNGAKSATQYAVNGNHLVDANGDPACSINLNDDGSITISDLQSNSKQSFQIAQTGENAISAYSSKLTISTTKEQKAAPTDVIATINEAGEATVTWNGDTSDKYTVLYTCTDSKGNVKTKVLTKNASVNVEGAGKFTTGKLLSGSKYTFSVYTNKGDNLDASVYVNSNEVITPTIVPAPQLKKIGISKSINKSSSS